ncbi:MAG: hypothetical protein ACXW0R_08785 [Gaiellaceae bacterium]
MRPKIHRPVEVAALIGASLLIAFAGTALIQATSDEQEAWDTGGFWLLVIGAGITLGAVFARSGTRRSAVLVGAVIAASFIVAGVALSEDDEGASFLPLTIIFVGPLMTLLVGGVAWAAGSVVARVTATDDRRASA